MKKFLKPWSWFKISTTSCAFLILLGPLLFTGATCAQVKSTEITAQRHDSTAPVDPSKNDSASSKALPTVDSSALANSICVTNAAALKGIIILIDPGHGGVQLGAHFGAVEEKNVNLAVAYKLRARLEGMGATVYMTRTTDTDISLEARVDQSIALRPDIFISVHANANFHRSTDGIETYYFDKRSRPLAAALLSSVAQGLHERPNWVKQEGLFVCHHNIVPSTLVEIGYLSNSRTEPLLITDAYQERAAESIAVGVFNYFRQQRPARGCIMSSNAIVQVVQKMKTDWQAHLNGCYRHKSPRRKHSHPIASANVRNKIGHAAGSLNQSSMR
jgi:N-acetylmuramoyl-L-alanine amidase